MTVKRRSLDMTVKRCSLDMTVKPNTIVTQQDSIKMLRRCKKSGLKRILLSRRNKISTKCCVAARKVI